MLYNLNPKLRQELEAEGYSAAMLVAIDSLQDNKLTMKLYKQRAVNALQGDSLSREEKQLLKDEWFSHAKAIAEFNEMPNYTCDKCREVKYTNDCKATPKKRGKAQQILCPDCFSKFKH